MSDELLRPEPRIGLGTMGIEDAERIASAIETGYRHLDTAQIYENERVVGRGVERAPVERADLSLATKVWAESLAHDDVLASTRESLDRLGVGYVDLLYVHRPVDTYDPEETLSAFDRLRDEGRVRAVGVSNFDAEQVAEAREILDAPLAANQVEMHPLYQQADLLADAQRHDYALVAYSPLAQGEVFDLPEIRDVAEKHDATPAQVSLAWLAEKDNIVPIPRSASDDHLRENLAALDLELDAEDVAKVESIDREKKLFE
ncbi:aldo/keto reductase [Halorussus sp. MSC15.2]|uniref:aldo/keto reductase n=1 Tax=Halorussus sp. MSC15.2 TaxID=2283638 RepID=UPI0013D1871F|nr:aldo/keto reductase [Halorussus sp. MSC15.2]NEU57432.1 aldo/keto reductase [Halorussus sp. MSC15.2]